MGLWETGAMRKNKDPETAPHPHSGRKKSKNVGANQRANSMLPALWEKRQHMQITAAIDSIVVWGMLQTRFLGSAVSP